VPVLPAVFGLPNVLRDTYASVIRTDDYSITSTTFINLDAINLILTIKSGTGQRILAMCICDHNGTAIGDYGYLDFAIDGVRQGGADGLAQRGPEVGSGRGKITPTLLTPVLPAGYHTVALMARVAGGTGRFGLMFFGTGRVDFRVRSVAP